MEETGTESSSGGKLERFLVWFLIPFVFTAVLLGVLLSVFDYDVMKTVQRTLNKIPVVGEMIPLPKEDAESAPTAKGTEEDAVKTKTKEIEQLNSKVQELKTELDKADQTSAQKDKTILDLKQQKAELEDKELAKQDEEYDKKVRELASVYAKMMPSKAAQIIQNLSPQETILVLNAMKTDERVKVLEKMDPKKAADASIALKDLTSSQDQKIAALQDRLVLQQKPDSAQKKMTSAELSQTFASMDAAKAAKVLTDMYGKNSGQVLTILREMDTSKRAALMGEIAGISKETAASITGNLVP
ncbi:MotE family protein [Paenibacillus sp. 1P03SA]|uniref:MotE family protein n=1 Tax=Paenibacillus sp. 1P03SA TaxID=3132294 RepID=UPI0039A22D56